MQPARTVCAKTSCRPNPMALDSMVREPMRSAARPSERLGGRVGAGAVTHREDPGTGPAPGVTAPATTRPPRRSLGRAALLIGSLTMLSSAIGFGRQLVFAHKVRAGCIGTA